MALPQSEWLHHAKGVPVGQTDRKFHGRERRPNLIVGNDADRWWCFCQACKQGGVVMKEHVKVTGTPAPPQSTSIELPDDIVPLHLCEKPVQDGVLGFLASKNMDAMYIPEIAFSNSRKRIMVRSGPHDTWLGRDSTGKSLQKWMTYSNQKHLGTAPYAYYDRRFVVVEDPLSFYKVRWAIRNAFPDVDVFAALGTRIRTKLQAQLMLYRRGLIFFDGDEAGYSGAVDSARSLRALGTHAYWMHPPAGLDPKDLTIKEIINAVGFNIGKE